MYKIVYILVILLQGVHHCGGCPAEGQAEEALLQCLAQFAFVATLDTIDEICTALQDEIDLCLKDADGNCSQVSHIQSEIQTFVDFFGCGYTSSRYTYDTPENACDFSRAVHCYDPVLARLSSLSPVQPLTRHESIAEYYGRVLELYNRTRFSGDYGEGVTPAEWQLYCGSPIDWISFHQCELREYLLCEPIADFYQTGARFAENVAAIQHMLGITQHLHGIVSQLQPLCDPDCITLAADTMAYNACVGDRQVIPRETGILNGDPPPFCSDIEHIADCARAHALECDVAALGFYSIYEHPLYQQRFDLCGVDDIIVPPERATMSCALESGPGRDLHDEDFFTQCESYRDAIKDYNSVHDVCRALDEELNCYARRLRCCKHLSTHLQPRLHRYALYNQLLSCSIGLGDPENRALGKLLVRSTDATCDYEPLLTFYAPLFGLAGVDYVDAGDEDLLAKFELLNRLERVTGDMCGNLLAIDFAAIEACQDDVLTSCPHARTCVFRPQSLAAKHSIDILDLNHVRGQVNTLCTTDCATAEDPDEACDWTPLRTSMEQVLWRHTVGQDTSLPCSALMELALCVQAAAGDCEAYKAGVANGLAPLYTFLARAQHICGQDYFPIPEQLRNDTSTSGVGDNGEGGNMAHSGVSAMFNMGAPLCILIIPVVIV